MVGYYSISDSIVQVRSVSSQNSWQVMSVYHVQVGPDGELKYVEEPNELDEEVKQLRNRVDILEIILKKEK